MKLIFQKPNLKKKGLLFCWNTILCFSLIHLFIGHCFGHLTFLLGHPTTKVKGLKCPTLHLLLKKNKTFLLPLGHAVSLCSCFFFFLRGCCSSIPSSSSWWLLLLRCCFFYLSSSSFSFEVSILLAVWWLFVHCCPFVCVVYAGIHGHFLWKSHTNWQCVWFF